MYSRRHLAVLLSIFFLPASAWGQGGWKEANRKEIEKTLTEYNEIFIQKAYGKLSDVCQVPLIRVSDDETVALNTMDEVIQTYRGVREPLDARGYKKSQLMLSEARISVLSANRVLVNLPYRRYKTDGSLLELGSGFYILSKSAGKWKISGVVSQDPIQNGKVY